MTDSETIIGQGTFIRGNLRGDSDLSVAGRLEGSIDVHGQVVLDSTSITKADVVASRIVLRGALVGDLRAQESIVLEEGSRVVGDIQAPSIRIDPGALFRGRIDVGEPTPPAPPPKVVQQTRPAPVAAPARAPTPARVAAPVVQRPAQPIARPVDRPVRAPIQPVQPPAPPPRPMRAPQPVEVVTDREPKQAPPPIVPTPRPGKLRSSLAVETPEPMVEIEEPLPPIPVPIPMVEEEEAPSLEVSSDQPPPPVVPALKKKAKGAVKKREDEV